MGSVPRARTRAPRRPLAIPTAYPDAAALTSGKGDPVCLSDRASPHHPAAPVCLFRLPCLTSPSYPACHRLRIVERARDPLWRTRPIISCPTICFPHDPIAYSHCRSGMRQPIGAGPNGRQSRVGFWPNGRTHEVPTVPRAIALAEDRSCLSGTKVCPCGVCYADQSLSRHRLNRPCI